MFDTALCEDDVCEIEWSYIYIACQVLLFLTMLYIPVSLCAL